VLGGATLVMQSGDGNEQGDRWRTCHESSGCKKEQWVKGGAHLARIGSSSDGSARMSRMSSGRS
jgi:hypothetical protein